MINVFLVDSTEVRKFAFAFDSLPVIKTSLRFIRLIDMDLL